MDKSPGLTVVQGTVVDGQPQDWPVELCCYDRCSCCYGKADLPLCCYATWCYPWLWAELAAHLDVQACPAALCCNKSRRRTDALSNYAAVGSIQLIDAALKWLIRVALGQWAFTVSWVHVAPCLTMRTRHVFEEKKGLPKECGHAYCADYWCLPCSAYQQAVYLKHVERKDFACCCYDPCGTGPAPGDMVFRSGAFNGSFGRGGPVTTQPAATHAATISPFV